MTIQQLIDRDPKPAPWSEGEKIPWNNPDFSGRMVKEHLCQEHDMASPRVEKIEKHVDWIHHELLSGQSTRILDLGCGPGLYTSRLARLGHACIGVDFSPASIAYARREAETEDLPCEYLECDMRDIVLSGTFGLVMMLHGEMNTFSPADMRSILRRAYEVLDSDGLILLIASTLEGIKPSVRKSRTWDSRSGGLFADQPHLELREKLWNPDDKALVERYFIIDAASKDVTLCSASMQAYTDDEYVSLLKECGFSAVEFMPSLAGMEDLLCTAIMIMGRKGGS